MKKILMVATYGDFFAAFETDNIRILNDLGYDVHLCANWENPKYNVKHKKLIGLKYKKINIEFERSPFSIKNILNFKELTKIMRENKYYLLDCHNPVVGVYARVAAKINKIPKIMYTAHGFQFHKGGRIFDWLIYYPVEYFLSYFTDTLVVINQEDYRILNKFHCKNGYLIPGVGFDFEGFSQNKSINVQKKKEELRIPNDSFVVISTGELSKRKNHQIIIRALAQIPYENIYYIIAGQGKEADKLKEIISEYSLEDRVLLLGHRDDISELLSISDIAALPSLREGLGISGLESLASGLPLLSSNVHGINDYSINSVTGFSYSPNDLDGFIEGILYLYINKDKTKGMSKKAVEISEKFDIKKVNILMNEIYNKVLK